MRTTQKLLRLTTLFFVTLLFSTILISALPPKTVKADGQAGSFISDQASGKVLDHQLYYFLKNCFAKVDMDTVPSDEVSSWDWFKKSDETSIRGGMYENWQVRCEDGEWIREAFSRFGFTNALDTFCQLDFTFNKKTGGLGKTINSGSTAASCKAGAGSDFDGAGSRSNQTAALDKLLSQSPKFERAKGKLTDAEEYLRHYRTFMNACGVKLDRRYNTGDAKNEPYLYRVVVVNKDGSTEDWLGVGSSSSWKTDIGTLEDRGRDSTRHALVATVGGAPQIKTCGQLATTAASLADAYAKYLKTEGKDDSGGDEASRNGDSDPSCESEGGDLAWFLCKALGLMDDFIGLVDSWINNLLYIDSNIYDNDSISRGWAVMRNLALIILVPMMMFMVIGTALNFGPFDPYTVKKALPRMFVASIFIVLSLPITQFGVQVSNTIGQGIGNLIINASPTTIDSISAIFSRGVNINTGVGMAALVAGFAGWAIGGLGVLLSFALVTVIALVIGFVILVMRQVLVVMLIVVAPLAILVWIFPGNDKLWSVWKTTFAAMLLLYPIISILLASGRFVAGLFGQ